MIAGFIARWPADWAARDELASLGGAAAAAWSLPALMPQLIDTLIRRLDDGYDIAGDIAIHRTAQVEPGVTLKGPMVIGPGCRIGAGAYLRGGVWLDEACVIGPGVEIKTSALFAGTRLAHFNFVGDALLGEDVNMEAGSIIANHRNESGGANVRVLHDGRVVDTGVAKFGALVGDGCRIGANAVIAPGALLRPGTIVERLALIDQARDGG